MVVPQETQEVTPRDRKPAETIEISVAVAAECVAVAEKLGIPYRAVRDVVAAHGADVLQQKLVGQVGAIYAAHVNGLLPMTTGPAAPVPTVIAIDTPPPSVHQSGPSPARALVEPPEAGQVIP